MHAEPLNLSEFEEYDEKRGQPMKPQKKEEAGFSLRSGILVGRCSAIITAIVKYIESRIK